MPKYTAQKCASCQTLFVEGDDIVVCPECGSPYHRECYLKEGRCINTQLHEAHEIWKPEDTKPLTEDNQAVKEVVCSNCGAKSTNRDAFCRQCGCPIDMEKATGSMYRRIKEEELAEKYGIPFSDISFGFGSDINKDDDVDGNTVAEYTRYVGSNFFYFIPRFSRFAKGNRRSFNISAFLFPDLYFFYRKMLPQGIAMLILTIILSIPSTIVAMVNYGIIESIPFVEETWFVYLGYAFFIIAYVLRIVAGFLANNMYYNKAKKDIRKIKETVAELGERHAMLAANGGVSWKYVILSFVAESIVSMVVIEMLMVLLIK